MNEEAVERFGLILALQAEVEGMKADNQDRLNRAESIAYPGYLFIEKANEIRNIVYCSRDDL